MCILKSSQERGNKEKSQNTTVTSNPILSSGSNVSSPKVKQGEASTSAGNKSATIPASMAAAEKQKQEKPKKKSKLSFLSRKKNKE